MIMMKYFLSGIICFAAIALQSCSGDCSQPTPQYYEVIDYDENFYQPVCGCDGETYTNVAVAECKYGILDHFPGECD